jgi:sugar phosphate isomerase/epimerase
MALPLALQIYTVREDLAEKGFTDVINKVADIGYVGVEPILNIPGTTIPEAVKLFSELGFEIPSAHAPLPIGDNKNMVLDYMAALDCSFLFPSTNRNLFGSIDGVKQVCDEFNEAQAVAAENGITIGVHNHWWEFQQVNGQTGFELMVQRLAPEVVFQVDTYWVKTAGFDPAQVVKDLGARAPSLHLKDGPAVKDVPQVPVGDGVMDFPSIIQAAGGNAQWLVVELDYCATDMLAAVEKSYAYLVGEGLARGKG